MTRDTSGRHFVVRVPERFLYVFGAVAVAVSVYAVASTFISASTVRYSPSSCTGDWTDPGKATTSSDPSVFSFQDVDASVLTRAGQKLFCSFGGVTGGEARHIQEAQIVLHFVPVTYREPDRESELDSETATSAPEVVPAAAEAATSSVPANAALEEMQPLPAGNPNVADPVDPEGSAILPETSVPASEEGASDDAVPSETVRPPPDDAVPSEPQSRGLMENVLSLAFPTAYADDATSTPHAPADEGFVDTVVQEAATSTNVDGVRDAVSRVSIAYSIDSTGWKDLGAFDKSDLIGDIALPLAISTASDVETLVVRVSGDELGTEYVYLDGISLDVTFIDEASTDGSEEADATLSAAIASEEQTVSVLSVNDDTVLAVIETELGASLLKVSDTESGRIITEVGGSDVSTTTTLYLKEGWVFWIVYGDMLHAYDVYSGARHSSRLVYDDEAGDIIALIPALPMTVVFRDDTLYFWTAEGTEEPVDARSGIPTDDLIDLTAVPPPPPEPAAAAELVEASHPAPTHTCEVRPFSFELASSRHEALVWIRKSDYVSTRLETGVLPPGVDVTFVDSGRRSLELPASSSLESSIPIRIESDASAVGNFSVPILFTQIDGYESTIACQFNLY